MILSHARQAWLPLVIAGLGFLLAALSGWIVLFRERAMKPARETWFPWTEAFSFAGLNAAGLVLIQLERLVIPHVLPLSDLATYGVLAAIAGSLFRVLQMGVGYTLLPRLRVASNVLAAAAADRARGQAGQRDGSGRFYCNLVRHAADRALASSRASITSTVPY